MDQTLDIPLHPEPSIAPNRTPVIRIRNVSVIRGGAPIVSNLSMELYSGEATVILGPNGCGKSTLIKILTREIYPSVVHLGSAGQIELGSAGQIAPGSVEHQSSVADDNDTPSVSWPVRNQSAWETPIDVWNRRVGLVSPSIEQRLATARGGTITVFNAIAAGLIGPPANLFPPANLTAEQSDQIASSIKQFNLGNQIDRTLGTLSTGQRRRVMIARALAKSPELLLLDEPTSGLDLVARDVLLQQIESLATQSDRALALVTHEPHDIVPSIRSAVAMHRGRIYHRGPIDDVVTDATLSAIYERPIVVHRSGDHYAMSLVR